RTPPERGTAPGAASSRAAEDKTHKGTFEASMPRPACCTTKHGTQRRMRICKRSRTPTDSTAVLSSPPGSSDGGERRAHAPSQAPGRPAQPLDTVTLADDAADV